MQWVLEQIGNAFQAVFNVLIVKPIGFILTELAKAVFSILTVLLKLTIFKPFSLTPAANGSNVVAGAAEKVWIFMAALSVGVAFVALLWASFTNVWGSFAGRSQFARSAWADVLEGVGIWLLVLMGGYGFLSMLLDTVNAVTLGLVHLAMQYQFQSVNGATVGAGIIGAILTEWLWPSMLLVLAGFMIWAVIVWVMRMVDLVVYTGLLPVTAALAITGSKQAWQWNWAEAQGAVFSQVAMAVMWWIAWLFIGGNLVDVNGSFGNDIVRLLMGLAAMTLVAKAPQMLQSITGHRHAGVGGMMMAAAGGYMLGRGAISAAKMTPLGQAVGKMGNATTEKSQNKLNQWADKAPLGSGPMGSALAGLAGGGLQKAAQAGKKVLGGMMNTSTGQVVSGAARQMWAGLESTTPGVAGAMRSAGASVASGARTAGASASSAAAGAARTVLQPNRSLGQTALRSDALAADYGRANQSHAFAVEAGGLGYDAMVEKYHPEVQSAWREMITAKPGSRYDDAKARYETLSQAAHQDVMSRIMEAPPNGANAYREARQAVQKGGARPRPTSYA